MSGERAPGSEPFTVRCGKCDHVWIAAYTPAPMARLAQVLRMIACPKCGHDAGEIFVNGPQEIGTCTRCHEPALLCTEIKGPAYVTVVCYCSDAVSIEGLPEEVAALRQAARGLWSKANPGAGT